MLIAVIITTYPGRTNITGIAGSLPAGIDYFAYNGKNTKSVAELWNKAINAHINDYDALIITQEDVRFNADTIEDLARALEYMDLATAWDEERLETKDYFGSFCFTMTKKLWDQVGPFDEGFEGYLYEDSDYIYRMNLHNCVFRAVTPVKHYGGISTKELTGKKRDIRTANFVRYCVKWGGDVGDERYIVPFNGQDIETAIAVWEESLE